MVRSPSGSSSGGGPANQTDPSARELGQPREPRDNTDIYHVPGLHEIRMRQRDKEEAERRDAATDPRRQTNIGKVESRLSDYKKRKLHNALTKNLENTTYKNVEPARIQRMRDLESVINKKEFLPDINNNYAMRNVLSDEKIVAYRRKVEEIKAVGVLPPVGYENEFFEVLDDLPVRPPYIQSPSPQSFPDHAQYREACRRVKAQNTAVTNK